MNPHAPIPAAVHSPGTRAAPQSGPVVAPQSGTVLVLGVGNVLYGDEGVGVHLIHHLRAKYRFPPSVTVMDGGVLGWNLLTVLADYDQVIIVDAVAAETGAVYRFTPHDIPPAIQYGKLSSHEWEVPELLWAMETHGDLPDTTLVAIGVDPAQTLSGGARTELSPLIRARLGALETVVISELERKGVGPVAVDERVKPHLDLLGLVRAS
ncbi:MAG TPA: HyaD/HybD family hydrogenase maturation endopeptidase [Deinococcales bacterium]|nr:HyaD/HybD family hydrogenase maturation endopeptidase [Deinococcales bacterium]